MQKLRNYYKEECSDIDSINDFSGVFINSFGDKEWRLNSLWHRENGPALERFDGTNRWYIHGLRHREDGPAVECINGLKLWYYKNNYISCSSNEEFLRLIKLKAFW